MSFETGFPQTFFMNEIDIKNPVEYRKPNDFE